MVIKSRFLHVIFIKLRNVNYSHIHETKLKEIYEKSTHFSKAVEYQIIALDSCQTAQLSGCWFNIYIHLSPYTKVTVSVICFFLHNNIYNFMILSVK